MARFDPKRIRRDVRPDEKACCSAGDTSLLAEIEHDYAVRASTSACTARQDARDGMGLKSGFDSIDRGARHADSATPPSSIGAWHSEGDYGIKDGNIVAVGRPVIRKSWTGVHPKLICGVATHGARRRGPVATPGGIDVHVHFDSAQLCEHASLRPHHHDRRFLGPITVGIRTAAAEWNRRARCLQASESWPINFGFLGPRQLIQAGIPWQAKHEQLRGGCLGPEDPRGLGRHCRRSSDTCLSVADDLDFPGAGCTPIR